MADPRWHRVPESKASAVCAGLDIDDGARMLLTADMTPSDCVEALRNASDRVHAIRVLARALTPEMSIRWACQCVRTAMAPGTSAEDFSAINAAEQWLTQPNDDNARAAFAAAEAAEFKSAAAWAAVAPFWAGDNMAPPGEPPLVPPPELYAKAVAGAVLLAAVDSDDPSTIARQDEFLDSGIIAAGGVPAPRDDNGKDGA
jgi:hypothetical protein